MHVAAIITIPGSQAQTDTRQDGLAMPSPAAHCDLLGRTVLERVLDRVRIFGIGEIALIPENPPHAGEGFWSAWDEVVSNYLGHGLQTLLLIRIGPYLEIDLLDFLRFHRETSSPLTQVYGQQRALDLVAVEAAQLREGSGSFRNRLRTIIPRHHRYAFSGYTNRLKDARDFRQLAKDALLGNAAIRPIGREIDANVWVGDGARVDASANIEGPAYIGKRTIIRPGAVITGASTVEQDCEIDVATRVHDSCIMRNTYIGAGLHVRNAVVGEKRLVRLDRAVQVEFRDSRLIGNPTRFGTVVKNAWMARASRRDSGKPQRLEAHL